jgi:hypothetical protein
VPEANSNACRTLGNIYKYGTYAAEFGVFLTQLLSEEGVPLITKGPLANDTRDHLVFPFIKKVL